VGIVGWIAVALGPIALVAALLGLFTLVARRRGYPSMGGDVVVRCREGHLFTTWWIPGGSIKAIRLGAVRYQHCPVGRHWTTVRPVKDADLTDEDRRLAAAHHDIRLP
jgi:hypothetical protein